MPQNKEPLVSIVSLVYNHRPFIIRAIESWLMQKTNFNFEIIIGEDFSTDGSREIVFDYEKKYPEIIKVITSDSNVGMRENSIRTKKAATGKYIAFCEGDDYWTDPLKLHKQVYFMESNPDFSLCFHDAIIIWDDRTKQPKFFCPEDLNVITTTKDVINQWYIPTASMLMKSEYLLDLPDWLNKIYNGDWATQLILSTKGKIKYINEPMSVYYKNKGALSGGIGRNLEFVNSKKIELLNYFDDYSNKEFSNYIQDKIQELKKSTKEYKEWKKSKVLFWLKRPGKFIKKHVS